MLVCLPGYTFGIAKGSWGCRLSPNQHQACPGCSCSHSSTPAGKKIFNEKMIKCGSKTSHYNKHVHANINLFNTTLTLLKDKVPSRTGLPQAESNHTFKNVMHNQFKT